MKLSIIIPVFNEEKTISLIIDKVTKVKLPFSIQKEIIVIDDGSTDKTSKLLSEIKDKNIKIFTHKVNQGKGAAVKKGFKEGLGDIFIIQDADLEYNPEDFTRLIKPIVQEEVKVVYGTRFQNYPLILTGKNKTPLPSHWLANKALTFLTNVLYMSKITDMETCYKLFSKEVIKGLDLKSNRFDIEPEITAKVLKKGYKILELPIKVKPRTHKEGKKIGWKDGFGAIWTLLKYRFIN